MDALWYIHYVLIVVLQNATISNYKSADMKHIWNIIIISIIALNALFNANRNASK